MSVLSRWDELCRSSRHLSAVHDLLPGDSPHSRGGLLVAPRRTYAAAADALPGQVLPVEPKNLLVVAGDFLVLENEAGVAVHQGALVRPIVAADQYPHSIDDDPLGVATVLESDLPHVESSLLHLLQRADRGELATDDDPQVYTRLLLLQQGIGQGGESIVVL